MSGRCSLASATAFALHFFSIEWCGVFLSENYLTLGLVLAVALFDPAQPPRCGFAGMALALGALAKPQCLLLLPLWCLLLASRRHLSAAAALVLGAASLVLPASYAATRATHHLQVLSAMGGVVMTQAWCPVLDVVTVYPGGQMGFGLPVVAQRDARGEVEATWGHAKYNVPFTDSSFYAREGLRCIARFPRHAVRTFFLSIADTFAGPPWSYQGPWLDVFTEFRTPTLTFNLLFCWLVVPFALWGMYRGRRDFGMLATVTLPVLSCVVNCAVFHGEPRFRLPYDFMLWIAACVAVASLWRTRATATATAAVPAPTLGAG